MLRAIIYDDELGIFWRFWRMKGVRGLMHDVITSLRPWNGVKVR